MKFRYAALGLASVVGTVAAANGRLRADEFTPPLGEPQATYRWRGFDVAYTELGDPDNPDLMLLHGVNAAGSSHEFREVAHDLADEYHVIAPDLPGFGGSARPPLLYSGSLYVAFVRDVLADLADDPVVIASSLSGAYAAQAATDVSVRELVLVCPTATTIPGRRTWLRSLVRSPVVGEALYNALTARPSIRWFLKDHGFAHEESITDEWVDYDWQTAHQPGARYAPASFIAGFLDLDTDLGADLAVLDAPVTVLWGADAHLPDPETGRALADTAGAPFVAIDNTDLLPHAEEPDAFLRAFREQVAAIPE
jgi:pimeloyl-ACP methyl ester carboxylesterase